MSVEVHPQFVVDAEGKPQSVLLSIEEYYAILARIEELRGQADQENAVADNV
jgi:hypothetical protein